MIPGAVVFVFIAALVRTKAYSESMDLDHLLSGYKDDSALAVVLLAGMLLTGLVLQAAVPNLDRAKTGRLLG
jgi:hypothetical protein